MNEFPLNYETWIKSRKTKQAMKMLAADWKVYNDNIVEANKMIQLKIKF